MGTVKETIKASTKGGKKLSLFQKLYKQYLKMFNPKEARIAAEKAAKEAKDKIIDKKVADSAKTIKKNKKESYYWRNWTWSRRCGRIRNHW